MDTSMQQLHDYVDRSRTDGLTDVQIQQALLGAGWPESTIQHALQQNVAQPSPETTQTMPAVKQKPKKLKPPIAAQVLYALAVIWLAISLFIAWAGFTLSSSAGAPIIALAILFGVGIELVAIVYALLVIGIFAVINRLRYGKRWALVTYSVFVGLGVLLEIFLYLDSPFRSVDGAAVVQYIVVGVLLAVLWIKNEDYFSR